MKTETTPVVKTTKSKKPKGSNMTPQTPDLHQEDIDLSGVALGLLEGCKAPAPAPPQAPAAVPDAAKEEVVEADIDPLLLQILRTKRAHGSPGDFNFRGFLRTQFEQMKVQVTTPAEGCMLVVTDAGSKTLFSCHIDTCHSTAESDGTFQDLAYDPMMGHLFLRKDQKNLPGCLGADDGVGVWIMLKMIAAGVKGAFLFHTGEERGGVGSRAMLKQHEKSLRTFHRAIAFDRADTFEVIVTQGGMSCASNLAGEALVAQFNKLGLQYEISHKGSFTDTKVYAGIIRECFNIGVGYYDQHTSREYLDVEHAQALVKACVKVDWEAIPTVRPLPVVPSFTPPQLPAKPPAKVEIPESTYSFKPSLILAKELPLWKAEDVMELVENDPEVAANLILFMYGKLKAAKAELGTYAQFLGLD